MKTLFGVKYRIVERSQGYIDSGRYCRYALEQRSILTLFIWTKVTANEDIETLKAYVAKALSPKVPDTSEIWRS